MSVKLHIGAGAVILEGWINIDHPHILIMEASGRGEQSGWSELEPYLRDLEITS